MMFARRCSLRLLSDSVLHSMLGPCEELLVLGLGSACVHHRSRWCSERHHDDGAKIRVTNTMFLSYFTFHFSPLLA